VDLLCRESSAGEAQTTQRRCNDYVLATGMPLARACAVGGASAAVVPGPPLVRQNRSHPFQGSDAQKAEPEPQGVGSESAEGQA